MCLRTCLHLRLGSLAFDFSRQHQKAFYQVLLSAYSSLISAMLHSCMQTHLEPVLAIPLAAFLSFVIAMTSNALILEYIHWKQCSFSRLQSSTSSMSVDASSRQETSSELATSQGSRELDSSQTSREFDIESGSANSRSPNFRRQAASEGHFMHYS